MGQGSDSCSGHEADYNPYEDALGRGKWITRNGGEIAVHDMPLSQLKGALRLVERASARASFSCDSEMWDEWAQLLESEISSRATATLKTKLISTQGTPSAPTPPAIPAPVRGKQVDMVCHCGTRYPARTADLKRGWGLSCSKACAAIRRDFGRPAAKRAA